MKIAIHNGRIIDPANQVDKITSLFIENESIVGIKETPAHFVPDLNIDAKNQWVLPGLVDMTCHELESEVALNRGFTSLGILSPTFENRSADKQPTLYPIGELTAGEGRMQDFGALKAKGAIALSSKTQITDLKFLIHCYEFAANLNLPIIVQPQEPSLLGGVAHQGIVASRLGLPTIPEEAETLAIAKHLLLAEKTGVQLHFSCLSTRKAVAQIREAKMKGLPISADVAMHSLHLTENDIADFNANCHVIPPLRHERDRNALLEGIKDNTLDAIACDHRPLDSFTKLAPFAQTTPGMSTLDTFLSLGLHLVNRYELNPQTLIAVLSFNLAKIFNLACGQLQVGALADLIIFDPNAFWRVEKETFLSQGKNSPFIGWELPGIITHIIKKGKPYQS